MGDVMGTKKTSSLIAQLIGLYLASWAIGCLCFDLYFRLKGMRFNFGLFFDRNLAYFGGWVAHIGMMIAIIGFLGNYRGLEERVTVHAGENFSFYGYRFEFGQEGIQVKQVLNATHYEAHLKIFREKDNYMIEDAHPAQSRYPTKDQVFNEIAITGNIWHDIYVVLVDFDKVSGKRVTFQVNINPTVRIVWGAIVLMVIGGIIALFDKYRGNRSRDVVAGAWEVNS
jgi:cytochrome c-type biogenesis protein CcmF